MSENVALLENTDALLLSAQQLVEVGAPLTLLNILVVAVGLLLVIMVMMDWKRRRWGNALPALLIAVGAAAVAAGFILLGIAGTPVGMAYYAVVGDDFTQTLLAETKLVSAPLAALAVIALSGGALYATLGGAALWKNRRQQREERQMRMEVAAA